MCVFMHIANVGVWLVALVVVLPTWSKKVQGRVTLPARQARVVTKFCFDYNRECAEQCPGHRIPGIFNFRIYEGQPVLKTNGNASEVYIALLDDEYYSFSEVSGVWDDLSCHEIVKAAKRSFRIDWVGASGSSQGVVYSSDLVQKVRPRWWYIAFASCSNQELSFSYEVHLQNLLQGWLGEFSMDMMGAYSGSWVLCIVFAGLTLVQLDSIRTWSLSGANWSRLHPGLYLLCISACLGALGETFWIAYFSHFQQTGISNESQALLGRACIIASKTMISFLLLLFSRGQCICTPDIAWAQNRELIWGLVLFGVVSFALELWGDSEFRSTSVEYVYDTRAGYILVTVDAFLLWLYISKSFRTFQLETRAKQRIFFKSYSAPLGLWFAALPIVSILVSFLSPWVRWRIAFAINSCVHVSILALLIYTFRPTLAATIYEMQVAEYAPISQKDLPRELSEL